MRVSVCVCAYYANMVSIWCVVWAKRARRAAQKVGGGHKRRIGGWYTAAHTYRAAARSRGRIVVVRVADAPRIFRYGLAE